LLRSFVYDLIYVDRSLCFGGKLSRATAVGSIITWYWNTHTSWLKTEQNYRERIEDVIVEKLALAALEL